jgi:hypothetical protein
MNSLRCNGEALALKKLKQVAFKDLTQSILYLDNVINSKYK